jgi:hypothetical protein
MHRKVAKKYLSRVLCDHLQKAVSEARIDLSKLGDLTERAISLVDESEKKDHIYKEAGEMIFLYQAALEDMQDQMAVISYIVEKLGLTSAADDLNPAVRKELDKALKGEKVARRVALEHMSRLAELTVDVQEMQGLPTYIDDNDKVVDDEGLDSEVPPPAETDFSDLSVDVTKPEITQDMLPEVEVSTPLMDKSLIHEVIAGYLLKYRPVRVSFSRLKQAKKITEIIQGLDGDIERRANDVSLLQSDHNQITNTLTYKATSGNKTYTVKIRAVPPEDEDQRHYWEADVKLSCSCPHWRYGGSEYHAYKGDYLYSPKNPRGTLDTPQIRDPENNNFVCKHMYKALLESKRIYFDRKPQVI